MPIFRLAPAALSLAAHYRSHPAPEFLAIVDAPHTASALARAAALWEDEHIRYTDAADDLWREAARFMRTALDADDTLAGGFR